MSNIFTISIIKDKLKTINPNIEILSDKYINAHEKMKVKCSICEKEYMKTWNDLQQGWECFYCKKEKNKRKIIVDDLRYKGDNTKKNIETFYKILKTLSRVKGELIGDFYGDCVDRQRQKFTYIIEGELFCSNFGNLRRRVDLIENLKVKCKTNKDIYIKLLTNKNMIIKDFRNNIIEVNVINYNNMIKGRNKLLEKINKNNDVWISGAYKNNRSKIIIKFHKCQHEVLVDVDHYVNMNQGCPICNGSRVVAGINDIFTTDSWMCDLGVSEEDAKKYSRCSNKKITVKCPDCGKNKKIAINNIYKNKSISCSCGDGKSYPEKFIFNLLEQLDVDFETEYSPKWIKPKRYDFHIKDNNCIIETHGRQHYDGGFNKFGGLTLKQEQINDKYKRDIALSNDIKHYIELDCRESNIEWIKNSILNSELNELYDLSNVNWTNCAEFANKNIVKEVCDYWNSGIRSTIKIGEKFNIHCGTVANYLKKGTKLGWCNYDSKEIRNNLTNNIYKINKKKRKPIIIINTGKIYECVKECAESIKITETAIRAICSGRSKQTRDGFTFKYVEDLTPEERIKYNVDEKLKELENK
ncbi:TPA: hypothetical protein I9089_002403 [Clostridium perfringens]|nr:hypothetical protein [Clostridium perfringens]